MTLRERIQQAEGTGPVKGGRFLPYTDTTGNITIGWGRNLTGKGISRVTAEALLDEDIDEAVAGAASFAWFGGLDSVRQEVVTEMVFNLGLEKFRQFKATIAAIAGGDYQKASQQMLKSLWSRQVGARAARLAKMMATGIALWLLSACMLQAAPEPPEVGDHYFCRGSVNGEPYEAELDIKRNGDAYEFTWTPVLRGFGIRDGDTLSVALVLLTEDQKAIKGIGVAYYHIAKDRLVGQWVNAKGIVFPEACTAERQKSA